ncbi:MAG: riboflavin biosynthesis protein RibF [Phycisphaerae bacterium]
MIKITCQDDYKPDGFSVVTIGNFDGVHIGHLQIIKKARKIVDWHGADKVIAVTFEPHPVYLLHPEKTPKLVTTIDMKAELLERAGVDELAIITDSLRLLNMAPEQFVSDFLFRRFNLIAVVEGADFHFGYGRSGDIETLSKLGRKYGFSTHRVELHEMDFSSGRQKVSSTLVRRFIESGQCEDACLALGRPYRLYGQIIKGRGIGRTIGFPTANIEPVDQVQPADGVYAGYVQLEESEQSVTKYRPATLLPAVYSIGRARTFKDGCPLLTEAHILSTESIPAGEIYGKWLAMDFLFKLRNQQAFSDTGKLVSQIEKDCALARELLSANNLKMYGGFDD